MKKMILLAAFAISLHSLSAQEIKDVQSANNNIVKLNLFSLPLSNFSVQYERILNKKVGLNLGVRFMPTSKLPYASSVTNEVAIQNAKIGNIAITPEARFYVGKKGYGQGFYIGPYYRFANFSVSDIKYDFTSGGVTKTATGKGSISSHSLGLLLGTQWLLGKKKNIVLDWTIFGGHYGMSKGNVDAVYNGTLTAQEQADLKKKIDDMDIPLVKKTTTVNANGGNIKVDGPWAGLRSSFAIGIKF